MRDKSRTSKRSGRAGTRRAEHAKVFAPNPFAALLPTVRRDVDARLLSFLDTKVAEIEPLGEDVTALARAIRDLAARGGKRLRPALLATGFRAATRRLPFDLALEAGVAVELLHCYLLIHDDWMDRDVVRRGAPSVHARFERRYRSAHRGHAAAVLAGDYAIALATEALARLDVPARRWNAVLTCFARMQLDAIAGQQLDLIGRASNVERVYELKTASYTVSGPLELGAVLGGASSELREALRRYAKPAGVAFQLRDDLLSVFGDPARTGKPFAADLKAGKKTLLVVAGMKKARGKELKALRAVFGDSNAERAALERAAKVLETCGAAAAVETRIQTLIAEATSTLESAPLTAEGRGLLAGALQSLTSRAR
ncbi:MAG TPA: polyprenyl synthetase family protein [Polyangiaceae bacterium]|jgi:geranylgeranyl diphosphate synthase type I